MVEPETKPTNPDPSQTRDLSQLSREFAAFNQFYACFCDTLVDMVVADEELDTGTVEGIHRCVRWMQYRLGEFSDRLNTLHEGSKQ